MAEQRCFANSTGYAHTIRALLQEIFPTERLSTLTMPTLVLVGDEGADGLWHLPEWVKARPIDGFMSSW